MQQPSEGNLSRFCLFLLGNLLDAIYHFHVFVKVLALKARIGAAIVILRNVFKPFDLSGEKSSSQWAVGYKPDA